MEGYCLKNGTLQPALDRAEGIVPAAIYHLSPDGSWRRMPDIPTLQAWKNWDANGQNVLNMFSKRLIEWTTMTKNWRNSAVF